MLSCGRFQGGFEVLMCLYRHHIRLAETVADLIRKDARFEVSAPPRFGLVCFHLKVRCSQRRSLNIASLDDAAPQALSCRQHSIKPAALVFSQAQPYSHWLHAGRKERGHIGPDRDGQQDWKGLPHHHGPGRQDRCSHRLRRLPHTGMRLPSCLILHDVTFT